jgi:hypothetical protein
MSYDYFQPSAYEYVLCSHAVNALDLSPFFRRDENAVYLQKANIMCQEIVEILKEHGASNWDEEGALPISPATAANATKLAETFPITVELPSLYPMANGKIAFQWVSKDKTAVLLSIDETGQLTYSAVLKNGERENWRKVFLGTLPGDVTGSLLRVAV